MIYGFSGKKQSGKNLVAKIWQILASYDKVYDDETYIREVKFDLSFFSEEKYSFSFSSWTQVAFADKLKDVFCILIGCDKEQLEKGKINDLKLPKEWTVYKLTFRFEDDTEYFTTLYNSREEAKLSISNKKNIDYYSIEEYLPTYREALQFIGTDLFRKQFNPLVWVNSLFSTYNKLHEYRVDYFNWLITDVRFPDELKAITSKGGKVIRVERFCYDSAEDFLCLHPDETLRKIGIQDFNIDKLITLEELKKIAKEHGYIPLKDQHYSETALDNCEEFDYTIDNVGTLDELIIRVKNIMVEEGVIE